MESGTYQGPESPRPAVSYVVIAYNESAAIQATIDSILAQRNTSDAEVIVIDDGSDDGTAAIVTRLAGTRSAVRLVSLGRNRGRGYARHRGVELARGALVATVDGDIILPPDWLDRCRAHLTGHDGVGGTAVPDGDVAYICARFGLLARGIAHTTEVTGSNALYRREVFDQVSFDPALREGEDVAFNHALRRRGFRLATVPGLTVEHAETKSFLESIRWLYQSGRGATRQLWRYREVRLPDLVFAGWVGCVVSALRRPRSRRLALPPAYAGLCAAGHLGRAVKWDSPAPARFAAAVLADALLLTAYFCGRLAGVRQLPGSSGSPGRPPRI